MLQKIYTSNILSSFELSIHQRILKNMYHGFRYQDDFRRVIHWRLVYI